MDSVLDKGKRIKPARWVRKPQMDKVRKRDKSTVAKLKDVVELAGWMYMPVRPSMAESARDAKYFATLTEMSAHVEHEYLINHKKMFIGISARGIENATLGVKDLRVIQVLTDAEDGTYFPIACGHCFTCYCTETWESMRRKAMM